MKYLLLALLFSCSHTPTPTETDNQPTPIPAPSEQPNHVENKWYVPKPMAKFQILKDSEQPTAGHDFVEIEAVPENDDTCANGYMAISKRIEKIHKMGMKVLCYHSLSYEKWRCDAENFPASAKGKKMDGWDELWPDWRSEKAHKFWDNRYVQFQKIGCDMVEDDNEVSPNDNATGFPLTRSDAEAASKYRSEQAHLRGMGHAAKNNPDISDIKSKYSDMVMIEEAGKYNERESYLPWKNAGKFGAMIEYSSSGCKPYSGFNVQYHSNGDYFSANYKDCNK